LRKNAALTRLAADAARMTYAEFDFKTGRLHLAENFSRVMGYTLPSLSEKGDLEKTSADMLSHIAPEDRAQVQAANVEFVAGKLDGSVTYRVIGDDGAQRWIEGRWIAEVDENGRLVRAIAASLDITERKRYELALRRSDERLRFALGGAKAAAWQWNVLTNELAWSPECHALYGRDPERDLARYEVWRECLHPDDLEQTERLIRDIMEKHATEYRTEYRVILPSGDIRWLMALGRMEYGVDGAPAFMSGINLDITARKMAEEALALAKAEAELANLAKSKFLAAASHDLRQPVQSLTLLMSVLKRQLKDRPKAADAVDMAQSSVSSLNAMLTAILDISRLDAGIVEPALTCVDLGELVDRLGREYRPRAAAIGLELRVVVSCALCGRTDAGLLERMARNLIENALRYTKEGGILLGLRRRGDRVRLDVVDTGVGIPAEHQSAVFEEFRQLNNPARDSSRGLGLGLAIVARLARLIGTEVQVASRLNRGTRFSLLLPLDLSVPSRAPAGPALEDPGGRILVIEDNEGVRQAYQIMLRDWGYEIVSAENGENALACAEREDWRFDVVLADQRLGAGLTGAETATEIWRRAGRAIPTMVVTGDTAKERLAEISACGFVLLHKPVEADVLRRTLASLLRGKS
jgi:PAS domain S-box-containing protein